MEVIEHRLNNRLIVELVDKNVLIRSEQDALDLIATLNYDHGASIVALKVEHLSEDFFDLKTKLAGSILQKFINYQLKLAIVGDIESQSESLKAFIVECNQGEYIHFANSMEEVLGWNVLNRST